ncbi:NADH-quinone oxidoreductase subunit L [Pradoshia sp. D12]|uniref:NADH-quinone oxidoreductase subunit L n=1 Tax=Bacillaceae TaxID=186817 RepID=UPI001127E03A|nr:MULTISPECIES: NADH-quinone oxidoreductase subunit L [Bacillaceae]QFK72976.1 NADH-quinone oxidoreductase subunit L [Pradoshia sp. D12]TPF71968.1 NADH-quinone oxidoreductase subunit L [Bacillus sp. D12]
MMKLVWVIPLFPLLSFVLLLVVGKRLKASSAYIGIGFTLLTFLFSLLVLIGRLQSPDYRSVVDWLRIGENQVTMGVEVNQLNALMLVIVSLVSLLVHIYSIGYMQGDGRVPVFFAYLGLFTFAMLGLVVSPNLLQLYIFWELVGLGSFLLIGFYFYKDAARRAAKKAFIMTRIGDIGLLIGIILLFWKTGSFEYEAIFSAVENGVLTSGWATATALLIFIGAIGKSGQFPLHTWLPDAMEGPTPVSALIHAATMVAAGVYLVATMFPLFAASETAMLTVAIVGAFTAIFAAAIATVQKDIKRILAYSTVSQLGYMMLALGTAGYVAGVFHLTTHAFFKALLFLAAGSVIHAVHTQNIDEMGGLWKKLRRTGPLFLIGTLALTGFPLLSGFFSKDEILVSVWESGHIVLFIVALLTSILTAFYMFRLFFIVFWGPSRNETKDVQESPGSMTAPMMILAVLSIFAGYVNTPWFGTFLGDWLAEGNRYLGHVHIEGPIWIPIVAILAFLIGCGTAWLIYGKRKSVGVEKEVPGPLYQMLANKFYVDEFYEFTIVRMVKGFGMILSWVEKYILQGIVSSVSYLINFSATKGANAHNGKMQIYGTIALIGLAAVLVIFAWTGGYVR